MAALMDKLMAELKVEWKVASMADSTVDKKAVSTAALMAD